MPPPLGRSRAGLAREQLGLADARHARAGVLEPEHEAAAHLALAACELLGRETTGSDLHELVDDLHAVLEDLGEARELRLRHRA